MGTNINAKNRIFIDCTSTFLFGDNTGIQRVVRNIIKTMPKIVSKNTEALPVVWVGKKFIAMPDIVFSDASAIAPARDIKKKLNPFLKHLPRIFKKILRLFFIFFIFFITKLRYAFYRNVKFNKDDIVLFPDASWNTFVPALGRFLIKVKKRGVKIGFIFHDVIPVRHPEYFLPEQQLQFNKWFNWALPQADFFIADSDSTRKDVVLYAKEKGYHVPPNAFNYPAVSFDLVSDRKLGITSHERLNAFDGSGNPVYVFVSTIEIRKNHDYAISAFEILWSQEDFKSKLFIIGKIGWLCEKTIERIINHPEYNKRLFMLNDVSDDELFYTYKNAAGVVFTSCAEGLGLPIVEGLSFGLPVFASDIPVHREIGKDKVHYCDLSDPKYLARMINEHTNEHTKVCSICISGPEYKLKYSWEESTRNLLNLINSF